MALAEEISENHQCDLQSELSLVMIASNSHTMNDHASF